MNNVNEVVVRYLAAWNEREPGKRRELVAKTWSEDGTYVDAARDGKGHDSLDAMIATAQGHFPGYPIMPGVLVVEAMAQAGGIIMTAEMPDREKKLVVFSGIERAKFRRPVTPGDQLRIEVEVLAFRSRAGRTAARRPARW